MLITQDLPLHRGLGHTRPVLMNWSDLGDMASDVTLSVWPL